jgi:transposase
MLNRIGPGQTLLADRAYDSDALRQALAQRGAWANVKPMPGRVNIPAFSPFLYRFRNLVERFFNKLKHFRAIATRFEKHDANYLALVKLAAARIWMRFMSR